MTDYVKKAVQKLYLRYRFKSILFRNFVKIFALTAILLSVLSIFVYNSLTKINEEEILQSHYRNADRIVENLNEVFSEARKVAVVLAADSDVRIFVKANNYAEFTTNIHERLSEKLNSYKSVMSTIHSIYIYKENTNEVFKLGTARDAEDKESDSYGWLDLYKTNKGKEVQILPRKIGNKYPYVLSYIYNINDMGCIVVNLDVYLISEANNHLNTEGIQIYISDENNSILYSNDETQFLKEFDSEILKKINQSSNGIIQVGDCSYAGYVRDGDFDGWKITVLTSVDSYNNSLQRIKVLLIISVILILGIIISFMLALSLYEPVSNIVSIVDNASGKERNYLNNKDEVEYVASRIMQMVDDNNDLKRELNNRMEQYRNLQFIALQSQINPHFLNNTLNVIGLKMVKESGMDSESHEMLTLLTRLIQHMFRNGKMQTDFKTEIELIMSYVKLLKKRYKNVGVEWDIDEGVYKYKILNFCIQPIIENAVFHGVGVMRENALVKIRIAVEDEHILINVTDNGKGMARDKLESLRAELEMDAVENMHVGMKNVYKRLKLIYADDASMTVESEPYKYTSITIRIPKNPVVDDEEE